MALKPDYPITLQNLWFFVRQRAILSFENIQNILWPSNQKKYKLQSNSSKPRFGRQRVQLVQTEYFVNVLLTGFSRRPVLTWHSCQTLVWTTGHCQTQVWSPAKIWSPAKRQFGRLLYAYDFNSFRSNISYTQIIRACVAVLTQA